MEDAIFPKDTARYSSM